MTKYIPDTTKASSITDPELPVAHSGTIVSNAYLVDCMDAMRYYPDKYFDLAIVDPPYGIDITQKSKSFSAKKFTNEQHWDDAIPRREYFTELFRVSKNQIIWGGNYFLNHLGPTKCMIVWDKHNSNKGRFADGEIAWTSFDKPTRIATYEWLRWYQPNMKNKQERIHPTQKPTQLYEWLMQEYSSPNDKILDTHMGSGSCRIAAYNARRRYTGFEISEKYFLDQEQRWKKFLSQTALF